MPRREATASTDLLGTRLAAGLLSDVVARIRGWLVAGDSVAGSFEGSRLLVGISGGVSDEALTVFLNDLQDFESDRRNTNHGGFTGESRVLVEGLLKPRDLKRACGWVGRVLQPVQPFFWVYYPPVPALLSLAWELRW